MLRTVLMTESSTALGVLLLLILPLSTCLALMPAIGALLNGTSKRPMRPVQSGPTWYEDYWYPDDRARKVHEVWL